MKFTAALLLSVLLVCNCAEKNTEKVAQPKFLQQAPEINEAVITKMGELIDQKLKQQVDSFSAKMDALVDQIVKTN